MDIKEMQNKLRDYKLMLAQKLVEGDPKYKRLQSFIEGLYADVDEMLEGEVDYLFYSRLLERMKRIHLEKLLLAYVEEMEREEEAFLNNLKA